MMRTPEFYLSEEWENEVTIPAAKVMFTLQKYVDKPYSIFVKAVTQLCYDEFKKCNMPECFSPVSNLFFSNPDIRECIYSAIDFKEQTSVDISYKFSFSHLFSKIVRPFLWAILIIFTSYIAYQRINVISDRLSETEELFNIDTMDEGA